jgi:hypothetical protein
VRISHTIPQKFIITIFKRGVLKSNTEGLNLCLYSEIGFLRVTFGQQDSFITDLPGLMILLPGW